jgi:hypothetical protein
MSVYLLATLDTKGPEAAFVRDRLVELGLGVKIVDTGCIGEPSIAADVSREQVFAAADVSLAEVVEQTDRGRAVTQAAIGATRIVAEAFARGGSFNFFFRPIKNTLWLRAIMSDGDYWSQASRHVRDFLSTVRFTHHFWLGARGFVGTFVWLLVPVLLFTTLQDATPCFTRKSSAITAAEP